MANFGMSMVIKRKKNSYPDETYWLELIYFPFGHDVSQLLFPFIVNSEAHILHSAAPIFNVSKYFHKNSFMVYIHNFLILYA